MELNGSDKMCLDTRELERDGKMLKFRIKPRGCKETKVDEETRDMIETRKTGKHRERQRAKSVDKDRYINRNYF